MFKRAVSQTALYGVSIAVMKGISILMLPFIAHRLDHDAFGRLEVLSSIAVVISILVGLGLENTLFRFAGQARDDTERRDFAARVFGLGVVSGLIALLALWFSAASLVDRLPGSISVYELRLVVVVLALESTIAIPMGWLRMQNHALSFFNLSIGRAALQAVLILALLQPGGDITPVLEAGVIATLAQAAVLAFLQIRDTGIRLQWRGDGELLWYSLPIVGSGLIAFVLNGLDRWLLADRLGLAEVADYGVAAKFALAAVLLLQPFGMWWSPRRFQVLAQQNGEVHAVRAIGVGISLCLIVCVGVSTAAPVLIDWLMPDSYALAAQYVAGLVLAMTLRELTELIDIGCFTRRSTWSQLWINLGCTLLGLVLMLYLIASLAVWGVIGALIVAQLARLLLFFGFSQHYQRLDYPLFPIALLITEALAWVAFAGRIDDTIYQLAYVLGSGLCMLGSAVWLRLIPVDLQSLRTGSGPEPA